MWPKRTKKSKFNAIKTKSHGYSFDSKLESVLYNYLLLLEKNKEIKNIRVKPNIHLTNAKILIIPDFSAIDCSSEEEVFFESKGFETAVWRIKRRLWKHYGPGVLKVYSGNYRNMFLMEEIIPKL